MVSLDCFACGAFDILAKRLCSEKRGYENDHDQHRNADRDPFEPMKDQHIHPITTYSLHGTLLTRRDR